MGKVPTLQEKIVLCAGKQVRLATEKSSVMIDTEIHTKVASKKSTTHDLKGMGL